MTKRTCYVILPFLVLTATACKNLNRKSPIPDVPVTLEIQILRDAPELNSIGGYKIYTKAPYVYQYVGFGGILLFHNFEDQITAFDLACPYEVDATILADSITADGKAVCRKCKSTFDIGYGSGYPTAGPSKYSLKKYRVGISGDIVHVTRY